MNSIAAQEPEPKTTVMAEFLENISNLNNGAMGQIGEYMATTTPTYRAQVIERLSTMIGSIASRAA